MKIFILILSICIKSALVNASTNQEEHILGGFFSKRVGGLTEALSRIDQEEVPLNEETLVLVDEDLFQEDRLSKFKIFSEKNCKLMFVKKNLRRFFSCDNEKYLSQNNISLFDPLNTEAFYFDGYYGAKIQNGYLHLPHHTPMNALDLYNALDLLEDHQWLFFGKILKAMLACFKDKGIKLETLLYLSRKAEMFRSLYLESFCIKVVPIFINDRYFLASRDPIVYLEPLKDRLLIPEHAFSKWEILIQKFIQDPVEFCKMIQARLENEYFSLEDIFYGENKGFRKKWLKTLKKYYQNTEELSPIHSAIKYGYFTDARDVFAFIRNIKGQTEAKIFQNIPSEIQNVTKFLNKEENYLSLLSLLASIKDKNKKILFLEQFGELMTLLYKNIKPKRKKDINFLCPVRLDVIPFFHSPPETNKEKKKRVINSAFKIIMEAFYCLDEDIQTQTISFFKKEFQDYIGAIFSQFPWPVKNSEGILKTVIANLYLIPFYPQILKSDFIIDKELDFTLKEMIKNSLGADHMSNYLVNLKTFLPDPSFIKKFFLATKSKHKFLKNLNTKRGVEFYKKISDEKFKHIMLYLDKNKLWSFTQVFGWETENSKLQLEIDKPVEETASLYFSFLSNFDLSTDEEKVDLKGVEHHFISILDNRFIYGTWKEFSQVSYKEYIREVLEKCSCSQVNTYLFALEFWQMCPYMDFTGYPKLVECLRNQDDATIDKITDTLKFYINQIPTPYTIFTTQGGTDRYVKLIKAMFSLSSEKISHFYEMMEKARKKKLDFILAKHISSHDKAVVLWWSGEIIYLNFEKAVLEAASDESNEKKF